MIAQHEDELGAGSSKGLDALPDLRAVLHDILKFARCSDVLTGERSELFFREKINDIAGHHERHVICVCALPRSVAHEFGEPLAASRGAHLKARFVVRGGRPAEMQIRYNEDSSFHDSSIQASNVCPTEV